MCECEYDCAHASTFAFLLVDGYSGSIGAPIRRRIHLESGFEHSRQVLMGSATAFALVNMHRVPLRFCICVQVSISRSQSKGSRGRPVTKPLPGEVTAVSFFYQDRFILLCSGTSIFMSVLQATF